MFHLVCDILVKHRDGTFLLMKRDPQKHFGGMWEATAGGSALAGENPLQCAIRELREETGIISTDLVEVGREVNNKTHSSITDWNKDKILLQKGETVEYKWVSREEILSMNKDKLVTERMQKYVAELN